MTWNTNSAQSIATQKGQVRGSSTLDYRPKLGQAPIENMVRMGFRDQTDTGSFVTVGGTISPNLFFVNTNESCLFSIAQFGSPDRDLAS